MPGNVNLRRELDVASELRVPGDYLNRLTALKADSGHTINVLAEGHDRIARFNCFAYALGIWCRAEYVQRVDDEDNSAIVDSQFIHRMLNEDALAEVSPQHVQTGDMVIYLQNGIITHAGVISNSDGVLLIRSKWGGNEVHEHPLWEVPASYGNQIRCFRSPDADAVLWRLREKPTSSDA